MNWRAFPKIVFILYCIEAGALFFFVPWTTGWEHGVMRIPFQGLREMCLHPILRAAVSGFGLVHLVWGAHDLDLLLAGWKRHARKAS